jgi:O-antigen/teichoic acid export membrane protein
MLFKVMSLAALAIPFILNVSVLTGLTAVRSVLRVTLTASAGFFLLAFVLVPLVGVIGAAITLVISYVTLGVFATWAVMNRVPFSLPGAFGRWRDAFAFARSSWRRVLDRKKRGADDANDA